jgi:hypothetical protein
MTDLKTVQRRIRPITIRCGIPGCPTKPQDAVLEERDDGKDEVIAPNGWSFSANVQESGGTFVGKCPAHPSK